MRTAIFVYEPTTLSIETHETNLELARFEPRTLVPLSKLDPRQLKVERGVYKIHSEDTISVTGDAAKIHVEVGTDDKDTFPEPPPKARAENLLDGDLTALHAFFAIPGAKRIRKV